MNAHTKETFDGPYRDDIGPIGLAIDELSLLLRDHHSGEQIAIDLGVIDFLAALMDAIGATRATVLSAYRGVATNQALARTTFGVADNSQHLYGRALDIRFDTRLEDSVRIARSMKRGGVGWYPRSGFVHIDTGPVRNWTLDDRNLDHLLLPLDQLVAGAGPKNWASDSAIGSGGHLNDLATGKTVSLPGGQDRLAIGRAFDDFLKHPIDRRLPLRAASRKALR